MDDNKDDSSRCPYRNELPELFQRPVENSSHQHPFISFKRFVDDQFAALTSLSFPSSKNRLREMQLAADELRQKEQDIHTLWTGRTESPDHDGLIVQRQSDDDRTAAQDKTLGLLDQAHLQNLRTDPAKIAALYADDSPLPALPFEGPRLSFGGACYYMPETDDNLPSTASLLGQLLRPEPRWLSVDWFKHSRYSPTTLEAEHRTPQPAVWRTAFEDLINSSLGKENRTQTPVTQSSQSDAPTIDSLSGRDWMLSLQWRGILPPQLPSLYNSPVHARGPHGYTALRKHIDISRQQRSTIHPRLGLAPALFDLSELTSEIAHATVCPNEQETSMPTFTDMDTYSVIGFKHPAFATPQPPSTPHQQDHSILDRARASFWTSVTSEDTDRAAELVREWEKAGRDVQDLIISDTIRDMYLATNTPPFLWPLCEALEKADSRLYREQSARRQANMYGSQWDGSSRKQDTVLSAEKESQHAAGTNGERDLMELIKDIATETFRSSLGQQNDEEDDPMPEPEQDQQHQQQHTLVHPMRATQQPSNSKPMVLAAMTTIHTTVAPDGTITKKTVLKKRFADGKEESTESVSVENPSQRQESKEAAVDDQSKKKGWFWS